MIQDQYLKSETCPSCQTKFKGKFCHDCGEKAFHESDYRIKKFITQTIDIFTHFDEKFLRSFLYIFTKPGFLTRQNMHGIRVKYAKPMQIFLLSNILFFLVTHAVGVTDYTPNIGDEKYGGFGNYFVFRWLSVVDSWVIDRIASLAKYKQEHFGLSKIQFSERFWLNSYIYSKSFIVVIIPFFAGTVYIFFKNRFKYFANALIFAAHFLSFQLIVFSILSFLRYNYDINILKPFLWLLKLDGIRLVTYFLFSSDFEIVNMLYFIPYIFLALKRIFPTAKPSLILLKAYFISKILFFINFVVYKKILIVLTLLLMH